MNTQLTRLTSALRVLLALLALILALPGLHAASATPPDRMTYQGFLVDANGVALGNAQPANHTVEFRIYDASTGGTAKWGEVQTVTVDKGYFSVLLGDGSVLGGVPNGPLSGVFQGADASDRFISVKVSSLAGSSEILPRLRLVTSPYAYMATTLPPGAITNGLFAAASITGDKLATNTLTAANFSTNVGLWTANGTNISRTGGFVGVGNATPLTRLDVGGPAGVPSLGGYSGALRVFDTSGGGVGLQLGQYSTGPFASFMQSQRPSDNSVWSLALNPLGGNVGIGTTTPLATMHVNGALQLGHSGTAAFNNYLVSENDGSFGFLRFYSGNHASGNMVMSATSWGSVGIGNNYPAQAKLVVNGTYGPTSIGAHGYLHTAGAGTSGGAVVNDLSIYASGWVAGSGFRAFSDERIKRIEGRSNTAHDLNTLTQIEVTDYRYVATIGKDNRRHKKVIAQQVEKVFPEAVTKSTDVIPDIFKKAACKDGWVELAAGLKVGERVKLIGEKDEGVHQVLEVRDGGFRTAFKPAGDKVFVYGREVKDFRSVDYEAISMLNVSATQELARKVKAQEEELTELRAELAKLRGERKSLAENISNLEACFARLEKAMSKQAGVIEAKVTGLRSEATARPAGDVIGASK